MKKLLASLGVGAAWILFSALTAVPVPTLPLIPPSLAGPLPVSLKEVPSAEIPKPHPFFSRLEREWQTGHLLAASA